ncbi:MAG: hypothetical protein AB8B99_19885 [Phormidesmis sp.]
MRRTKASKLADSYAASAPKVLSVCSIGGAAVAWVGVCLLSAPAIAQSERFVDIRDPDQVPTARYGRGEDVDLSLIIEEWRDRYPATPVFVCTCRNQSCGDKEIWPFREYSLYQPFVSLGDANATNSEATGFKCFEIETGRAPRRER